MQQCIIYNVEDAPNSRPQSMNPDGPRGREAHLLWPPQPQNMQHRKKQSHLLYQKAVPSRCDRGGIAITIRSCQNNHFAFCSWSVILIGLIFAWWFEAVLEQPACSVGAIPYTYKKISDMEQISEQPTDI